MRNLYFLKVMVVSTAILCLLTSKTTLAQDLGNLDKYKPKSIWENLTQGDPFKVAGGAGLNLRNYNSWGGENRQSPFSWTFNANANVNVYKINMPFSVLISAQNTTANHPFNFKGIYEGMKENLKNRFVRFGASPYYKWAKLHVGHRSMDFSSLTYSNQTFLGVGTELTPGKYRIAAMYGLMPQSEPVDLALFEINREVFSRKAATFKMGYGDDQQFVDLIFMKGRDRDEVYQISGDSAIVTPEENMVIGLNGQINLLENLNARLEIASSGYSQNSLADLTEDANILHPKFLLPSNVSTTYTKAINGGWQFQGKGFSLGMDYQRFDPGYKTMGVYYFNDDLQNILINSGFNFTKRQLNINLSGGIQSNNLDEKKPTTVKRTIGSVNVSYALKNLQTNFSYNNFSNNVEYVLNPSLDSLNAVVVTENTALNLSYTLATKSESKHSFSLALSSQVVNAPTSTDGTGNNTGSRMRTANLTYNNAPSENGIKWTARANYNQNELSGTTSNRIGFGLGLAKKFLDNKINMRLDNNFFISNTAAGSQNSLNVKFSTDYKVSESHAISLKMMLMNRGNSQNGTRSSQSELVNTLQYKYRFQYNPKERKAKKMEKAEEALEN